MARSSYFTSTYRAACYPAAGYSAAGYPAASYSASPSASYRARHRFGQPGLVWCMASLVAVPATVPASRWQRITAWLRVRRQAPARAQVVALPTSRHAARLSRAA